MSSTETMRYWPRKVECGSDVPPVFRKQADEADADSRLLIYAPQAASPFASRNEHLIVLLGSMLTVHTAARSGVSTFSAPLDSIGEVEWGCVLLRSWLRLVAPNGEAAVSFNTVREDLFMPLINRLRGGRETARPSARSGDSSARPALAEEKAKLDYLITSSYKFMSYGRRSLLEGETIAATLYQAPLPVRELRVGGFRLLTQYSTARLLLLTDRELIVVREEKELSLSRKSDYGCVRTFIPVRRIVDFQVEGTGTLVEIRVATSTGRTLRFTVSPDNPKLPSFLDALHELTSHDPIER